MRAILEERLLYELYCILLFLNTKLKGNIEGLIPPEFRINLENPEGEVETMDDFLNNYRESKTSRMKV